MTGPLEKDKNGKKLSFIDEVHYFPYHQTVITLALFLFLSCTIFLSAYLPGRILISKLNLSPLERVACSFAITLLLLYFLGFGSYVFFLSPLIPLVILFSISLIIFLVFLKNRRIPKEEFLNLSLFFIIFLILLSIQGLLPYYTGGLWYFDWFEHYDRSLFFLKHFPLTHQFGPYLLTARPPFFNVVAMTFQSLLGSDFFVFQIAATLLNSLIFLPILLFVKQFSQNDRRAIVITLLTAGFFLLNPAIVKQATFTWTKSLSAFFVLLGLYTYMKGRSAQGNWWLAFSFLFLGASFLTHYSGAGFILAIGADFLLRTIVSFRKFIVPFILSLLIFLAVVSAWFLWASQTYGPYQTFLGNTAYEWLGKKTLSENVGRYMMNGIYAFIPIPSETFIRLIDSQMNQLVRINDYIMNFYLSTISGNLTVSLSLILCYIFLTNVSLIKKIYHKKFLDLLGNPFSFIVFFLILSTTISIIEYPVTAHGIASVTLFPSFLLLFSIAVSLLLRIIHKIPRFGIIALCVLVTVEVIAGILLPIYVVRTALNPELSPEILSNSSSLILPDHLANWNLKSQNHLVLLYDRFLPLQPLFAILIVSGYIACVAILWKILLQPQIYGKNQ